LISTRSPVSVSFGRKLARAVDPFSCSLRQKKVRE